MFRSIIPSITRLLLGGCLLVPLACVDDFEDGELETELRAYEPPVIRLVMDGPTTGTKLVREVSGSGAPSTVEVRFEPLTSYDQLVGEPAAWCNSPAQGQPLIFDVPVPANPGDPDTIANLEVSVAGAGPGIRVPVTIKHGV